MPKNHKTVYGWSSDRFVSWTGKTAILQLSAVTWGIFGYFPLCETDWNGIRHERKAWSCKHKNSTAR